MVTAAVSTPLTKPPAPRGLSDLRLAHYSIVVLNSTIERAVCKSLMAPVLAIESSITRGLRAGDQDEDRRI